MHIVAPIPFFFAVSKLIYFLGRGGGAGAGANDRPGTDHVTSGPMRGLETKLHLMVQTTTQTDGQTNMVTL